MEEEADVEIVSFDEAIARYWQDSAKAEQDLITALYRNYPPECDPEQNLRVQDLESRYRDLALKSCEIIDMDILGGDDRHLVHKEMEVRRLYVGLRMRLEVQAGGEANEKTLEALERRRVMAWGGGGHSKEGKAEGLVSLGERLQAMRRLVVLGDPGAGKSTLLRWLATAYLLRLKNDLAWRELPDIGSLPEADWLPILIRCRDLPPGTENLDGMLRHSLRKNELSETECTELVGLLRGKLKDGAALLLVDGLDEITEPSARARFSQQLEQIHRANEQTPMVVTSRIVGYREMGYRLRSGFEHLTVAEFTSEDKDDFARRWCQLTEEPERRERAATELIHDIHSTDRIERLTGNPMLLATMALVKRSIGVLPQRRAELYEEAVKKLLNWRSVVDKPIDAREALPQLRYLAHAMCDEGIQAIREDQALNLLRQMRRERPELHLLSQHSPEDFLALLERRTGLLIQSGLTRHDGESVPVYEFRHLTFQEYLAGVALVQGHYRNRDPEQGLADVIAPLAGLVEESELEYNETAVVENWREALRLCIAVCNDKDVDVALRAILQPLPGETGTERPRAVMAALCLADEPNVSEMLAIEVLKALCLQVGKNDGSYFGTSIDIATNELSNSRWSTILGEYFLDEFFISDTDLRKNYGCLYVDTANYQFEKLDDEIYYLLDLAKKLQDSNERDAVKVALKLAYFSLTNEEAKLSNIIKLRIVDITEGLFYWLQKGKATGHAMAWALNWMNTSFDQDSIWCPNPDQLKILTSMAMDFECDHGILSELSNIFGTECVVQTVDFMLMHLPKASINTAASIISALGAIGDSRATDPLISIAQDISKEQSLRRTAYFALGRIGDDQAIDALLASWQNEEEDYEVREYAAYSLGKIDEDRCIEALLSCLHVPEEFLRRAALGGLVQTCADYDDRRLCSVDFTGWRNWLDPQSLITSERIAEAAEKLKKPPEEIRQRYAVLAERFGLQLA